MKCREFNRLLNESGIWDGTGGSRREMDLHRSGCRRCAQVWQAERMLRAMILPPTPPTLLERICALIDEIAAGVVVPFPVRRTILIVGLTLAVATAAAKLDWIEKLGLYWRAVPEAEVEAMAPIEAETLRAVVPEIEDPIEADVPLLLNVEIDWERIVRMPAEAPAPSPEGETRAGAVAALEPIVIAATEEIEIAEAGPPPSESEDETQEPHVDAATPPNVFDTLIEIEMLIAADERERATGLAANLLAQVAAYFGDPSREMADTHFRLAALYRAADDFDAAVALYDEGIHALINNVHALQSLETELIEPVVALGDLYQSKGYHRDALEQFEGARNIGRRQDRLHNPDQIEILERISRSLVALGHIEIAGEYQLEMRRLVQLNHGANSLEALRAHYRYADWIRSQFAPLGLRLEELTQVYTDVRVIISEHDLDGDPAQAIYLRLEYSEERLGGELGWGRLDTLQPVVKALTEARAIYESNSLDDALLEARIALLRGDLYLTFDAVPVLTPRELYDMRERAQTMRPLLALQRPPLDAAGNVLLPAPYWGGGVPGPDDIRRYMDRYYREAWDATGRLPNGDALRAEWFSQGTAVVTSAASSHVVSTDPNDPKGSVEVAFDIDRLGRARRTEIVRSDPEGLLDNVAKNRLSEMRFRPGIVDGRIVESTGRIVLDFQYDPEALAGRRGRASR